MLISIIFITHYQVALVPHPEFYFVGLFVFFFNYPTCLQRSSFFPSNMNSIFLNWFSHLYLTLHKTYQHLQFLPTY